MSCQLFARQISRRKSASAQVAGSIACRLAARGSHRAVASASTLRMAVAVESAEVSGKPF